MKHTITYMVIVFLLTITLKSYTQCNITALANTQEVDTIYLCQGDHLNLQSHGGCDNYLMINDFNDGTIGQGWSSNANPMFNNPCVAGPDGSICLWIGPATNFPRELVTVPFSVNQSCKICFDMIYSVQGVSAPCEGPDLPAEGVHLQWSNNGGATWTDINYWAPNGGYDPVLTSWHNYCCNVPVAGSNIQFRWYQTNTSGNNYDHWGIDNVIITCPSPPTTIWWTGPGGFSYNSWNPPSFVPTLSGWYAVHITDGNYIAADSIYVLISPPLLVTITPANATLCYGQTSTTITANVTGGNPPYSYVWSNGATTQSITVGTGTFSLLVNDLSGCSSGSASVTINANTAPITVDAGANQTLCITASTVSLNGSVTIATGGIWTGGGGVYSPSNTSLNMTYYPTSSEIQNGTVTLILTSTGNGSCPAVSDTVVISFVNFQGTVNVSSTQINCYNGNNGTATVNVLGGNPPFSYIWNTIPPQTTQTVSNLTAGYYSVTIIDGVGCTSTSAISISQPPALTALIVSSSVSCYGGTDGYATVTAFGGTPGYSYQWSNGGNNTTLVGLTAGIYTVTVTDALGCQYIATTQITSPAQLSAVITSIIHVDCANGNNGSATVIVTGGTPDYSYIWSSGAGTSQTVVGLVAGSYTVTVTDHNNCTTTSQVNITEPSAITMTLNSGNVSCFGGSNGTASVIVTGGSPPYMYVWSPYGGNNSTANNLIAGIYNITVTDSHGCQQVSSVIISQPEPLLVTTSIQNVQCYNTNTGSAILSVTGGVTPYHYTWNPNVSSLSIATGLSAGNYTITVSDANNCTVTTNIFINQPLSPLSVNMTLNNISCYGMQNGSMTANPTGGTPPYVYYWQPSGSTSQTINNLTVGNYFVTVTDANHCTIVQSASINQPGGIILNASTINANCGSSNGQASLNPTGGNPPYTYYWLPGGITSSFINAVPSGMYNVTVTDITGCSTTGVITINDISGPSVSITGTHNTSCFGSHDGWASVTASGGLHPYTYAWYPYGGNSDTAWALGAGTYTVIVSDANGCQGLAVTNPSITQPQVISISSQQANVTCYGASNGSINLFVTGGTPPYSYLWSPNGYTIPNPIGLSNGTYTVTVIDMNSCEETYFVNITEPPSLSAMITSVQNISCYNGNDGSISIIASGGTPPYSYLWSPSGTTASNATGLSSGTHTVYITDAKGCSYSLSVVLTHPPMLSLISGFTQPSCNGGSDGMAWVFASGGTYPYLYSWSPTGGSNDTASSLQAGIYIVTVTDQMSCQQVTNVQITQPSPLTISINNYADISCFGGNNGYAIVSLSGGTPGYQYNWSNGGHTPAITNLLPGIYYVTVLDSKGCSVVDSITIHQPSNSLSVNITHQNVSCFGINDGSASAQPTGGTPPYSFIWVPTVQFSSQATGLTAGTYTVSITDANGCQVSGNVTLTQPEKLLSDAVVMNSVACFDTPTGAAMVNVTGGVLPYSYAWNTVPVQHNQQATNIFAGMYHVTATDANGCTIVDSVFVTQPPLLQSVIVSQINVSCYQGNNGLATGGAIGGTPPYSFAWNTTPVQNTPSVSELTSGSYTLTVTDINGCTATSILTILQPTPIVTIVSSYTTTCLGDSVNIAATGAGGYAPYIFNWNQSLGLGSNHTVSPTLTTSYIVTAYDAHGCAGIPDTITVHVLSLYPEDVSLSANSPICPGNSSQISLTAYGESYDTLYYSWSHGLGPGMGPFTVVPQQPTWYRVTVTNTCNFSVIDSVWIDFAPSPFIQFTTDITQGCVPITVEFTDNSWTIFDDINYWEWHFGDGTSSTDVPATHTYNQPGTYYAWLSVSTTTGCTSNSQNNPLPIYVFETPVAKFITNKDVYYLPNDPVVCINQSSGAVAYWWDFGDGSTSQNENPVHTYNLLGQYQILMIATNMYQCSDTAFKTINVSGNIIFPNAFTPNQHGSNGGVYNTNDYSNHVFFPVATGVSEFKMQIFNRWGELIFETNDIAIGWDGYYKGQLCQQDVYVYQATATFIDGRKVEKKGDVLLIR